MSLKNSKKELVRSAVSLSLCCALFAGGTLAYFTKTVSSEGNIITTKKLDVELLNSQGQAITGAILSDEEFVPGSCVSETITVKNTGDLDFYYTINLIKGDNEGIDVSEALQEAIVVYVDDTNVGSLKEVLNGSADELKSSLKGGNGAHNTHRIELKMPHKEDGYDADTYSEKTVGKFTVQVVANEIVSDN